MKHLTGLRMATVVAAPLMLLAGCASFSSDGAMGSVSQRVSSELDSSVLKIDSAGSAAIANASVGQLLRSPLTAESAVQVALLNNRGLQAAYNALGVSEADYVQATLPPSPRVTLSRMSGNGEVEVGFGIIAGLLDLVTLPRRAAIAADEFTVAQLKAAQATLKLAIDTRAQFYRAVAARERVSLLNQVRDSAVASSELARRLGETGALNTLAQAREHALTGEVEAQLATARLQQQVERERLTRLLGLWGTDINYALPASVPALPPRLMANNNLEAQALVRRADIAVARVEVDALAKSLGLADATRIFSDIEVGGVANVTRTADETIRTAGLEVDVSLNLFDVGGSKRKAAEQRYQRAVNLLLSAAVNARSEVREAYQVYRGRYDIARLFERQILPVRKIIEQETLLHYNGMLVDIPALIADARARILTNVQAIEARRDFWIAAANLQAALVGAGGGAQADGGGTIAVGAAPEAGVH